MTSREVLARMKEISVELTHLANLQSGPETDAILKADAALSDFLDKKPTPWLSQPEIDEFVRKETGK